MSRKAVILILAVLSCAALCEGAVRQTPLRDGFGLTGVDGKLSSSGGKCFFETESDVSDGVGQIKAGTVIELLPSTALEKITADAQKRPEADYRLWGNVTKYEGSNFIFPIYFLPVSSIEDVNRPAEKPKARIAINEPNDALPMPEEIVRKLKSRRVLRQEQLQEGLQLKQDYVLTDRTALLGGRADGEPEVILDAIGRNIPQISIRLLPCAVLERAQAEQAAWA